MLNFIFCVYHQFEGGRDSPADRIGEVLSEQSPYEEYSHCFFTAAWRWDSFIAGGERRVWSVAISYRWGLGQSSTWHHSTLACCFFFCFFCFFCFKIQSAQQGKWLYTNTCRKDKNQNYVWPTWHHAMRCGTWRYTCSLALMESQQQEQSLQWIPPPTTCQGSQLGIWCCSFSCRIKMQWSRNFAPSCKPFSLASQMCALIYN